MSVIDDGATRDVSSCERLILIINYVYTQLKKHDFNAEKVNMRWAEIDMLKAECNVLPSDFQAMLDEIEKYRQPKSNATSAEQPVASEAAVSEESNKGVSDKPQ